MQRLFSTNPVLNLNSGPGCSKDGLNEPWVRCNEVEFGDVCMTLGPLSHRSEFTLVPSHGSRFVYMIPPQNVMPAQVTPA